MDSGAGSRRRIDRRTARRVATRPWLEALETRLAPAAATHLVAVVSSPVTADRPFTLAVEAEDDSGNIDGSYNSSVVVILGTNPGGSTLGGATTAFISDGVASFPALTLDQPGSPYTLQVASGGLPLATTNNFDVTVASGASTTAAQLKIIYTPPPTLIAGQTFGLTVEAVNTDGSTVDTTYSGSAALGLSGGPVGTALSGSGIAFLSNGVATFTGLSLNKASTDYQIHVSSGDLAPASTPVFTVTAATPTQLVVTSPPPASVAAGQPFGLTIAVEDQYGNVATGYNGNLAVAPSNSTTEGSLGGALTIPVAAGSGSFSGLSLVKAGTPYTLQVSATGLPTVTTSPFSITAAPAVQLGVVAPTTTSATAGVGFGLMLAAEDVYGNVVSTQTGSVTVSLAADPTGDTLAGVKQAQLSGGLVVFSGLTLIKAGSGYVLQASGAGLSIPLASEPTLSVMAGAPSQLALVSSPPPTVTAGVPFNLVLAGEDQYGNVVTTLASGASLALGNNPGGSILSGAASATFSSGLASFTQLTLNKVGMGYTLLASSNSMTPTAALANLRINVAASPATQLVVTTEPPYAVTTGQAFGLTVTAEDAYGNPATTFTGNVAVAPSNIGNMGRLGGPLTTQASGGVAVFSGLSLEVAGSPFTLQISSTGLPLAVTSPFTVSTGQATQLVVTSSPSSVSVGTGFGLTIAAEDPYGNVDGSFGGTVTLAIAGNPAAATLGGTLSATAVGGVATFTGLTLDAVGPGETLLATTSGLNPATTGAINVVASGGTVGGGSSSGGDTPTGGGSSGSTPTEGGSSGGSTSTGGNPSGAGTSSDAGPYLVISDQPATVTADHYFKISVIVEDSRGQVETGYSGKVTVSLAGNPSGAVLGGTLTMPVLDGVLTFYGLTLNAPGSGYTIRASAGGFRAAISSPITVVDPASAVGVVGPPPASVAVRQGFGLTVAVEGASGSVVPDYSGNVTIAMVGRHGGATLRGPRTVRAVGGVAHFTGLALIGARKGSAVALRITADGVGNAATVVLSIPARVKPHHPAKGRVRR